MPLLTGTTGDIMSLSMLGTTVVILSSYQKSIELLDKKGTIYSGRPHSVMTGELMGYDRETGFLPYGPKWKTARKWFSQEIGSKSRVVKYSGQLESQTKLFLREVANSPDDLNGHISRYI